MKNNRRDFLKLTGFSGAYFAIEGVVPARSKNMQFLRHEEHRNTQIISKTNSKKIILFDWSMPTTDEFNKAVNFYENVPFDGIGIKLSGEVSSGNLFMVKDWEKVTPQSKEREIERIKEIAKKGHSKDNFLVLYGASQMDWFSDEDWTLAKDYIRYAGKLAKLGNFKGVFWDPEPYEPGKTPWHYAEQEHHKKYSFNEYYAQIRQRGVDFITILQEEFPDIVVFSLRALSDYQSGSPFSAKILPVVDKGTAEEAFRQAWWGLHLPFTIGMIEGKNNRSTFIDGNEDAYYYASAVEYFKFRNAIYNEGQALIPNELREKFKSGYSIGYAVSTDYIQGNWFGLLGGFSKELTGQGKVLSPMEQALWFEYNLYHALLASDEYVWIYTERPDWRTGEGLPRGFRETVKSAKQKVTNGEPLGFSVEDMLEKARVKAKALSNEKG